MNFGRCINKTGETILVYGPKSPSTPQDKDNALYKLPTNKKTPDNWDCDGIYVPNDRIAKQAIMPDIPGPVAVKYINIINFEIHKEDNKYVIPPNQGTFKPSEIQCPTPQDLLPNVVCWDIPDIDHNSLDNYPLVSDMLDA